jgi:ferritin-like protein
VSKNQKAVPELDTPTDMPPAAVDKNSASLNTLLADAFALYVKTKNFHWHVSGRHFHDYHLLLDEQSDAIFATTDQLAERVRKLGGSRPSSTGPSGAPGFCSRRAARKAPTRRGHDRHFALRQAFRRPLNPKLHHLVLEPESVAGPLRRCDHAVLDRGRIDPDIIE